MGNFKSPSNLMSLSIYQKRSREACVNAAANYYSIKPKEILSTQRGRNIVTDARAVAMFLFSVEMRGIPYVADEFNRDHSSVIAAIKKIKRREDLQQVCEELGRHLDGDES